ncbi:MAG: ParA family protein [Alphaproteobacteria bacterium]
MTHVIAVTNQKGGVGKTTSAINLATAFAAISKKTLLIDLDPQGNASTGVSGNHTKYNSGMYEVLTAKEDINNVERMLAIPHLTLLPSTPDLAAIDVELSTQSEREYFLKSKLADYKEKYDYIIIDCPPALGLLTINAIVAADSIVIPLQCEFYALEGLSHLIKSVGIIKDKLNPQIKILGILLTMFDKRNSLNLEVEQDVRGTLGNLVLNTVIPRNVKVSEAPSHGLPALIYDVTSSGSRAYIKLAAEIIKKDRGIYECKRVA